MATLHFSCTSYFTKTTHHERVDGVAVSMVAFQAIDPGSTPGPRSNILDLEIALYSILFWNIFNFVQIVTKKNFFEHFICI